MIIVLVTHGKHEDVDTATVKLFQNMEDADVFIKYKNTGIAKYWTKAEIVEDGEEISLNQPE